MKFLLLFLFTSTSSVFGAMLNVPIEAEAAIVMNAKTGTILYQKNAKEKMFPASITKIATAAYALKITQNAHNDSVQLDQMITAEQDCIGSVTEEAKQRSNYTLPSHWLVTDCCHMGIKKGEKLSLKDLLYGMMLASADDASNMIAYALSNGHIPTFMDHLNQYLQALGCKDTFFNNPHGLHHPKHVTTAYDMAILTKEALKNPLFRQIILTTRYTRPKTNKQDSVILIQTNRLLRPGEFFYPKAIGGKTGSTLKAGSTFVAAAQDGDRLLIVVLMKEKERKNIFRDSIRLFEAAFNQPKMEKTVIKAGPQKFVLDHPDATEPIKTFVDHDLLIAYYPAEEPTIRAFLKWDSISLPINKGQKMGELNILDSSNNILNTIALLSQEDVQANSWLQIKQSFQKIPKTFVWIGIVVIGLGIFYFAFKR